MIKFCTVAAVALVGLMGTAANATNYPVTFNAGTFTPTPAPRTTTGSFFQDTFTFNTSVASTFSGSLTTRYIFDRNTNPATVVSDMDFLGIDLDGTAWAPDGSNSDALETYQLASTLLGAGAHTITVTYKVDTADADNGATYGGVFNLATSNVPEPASWAMFIGGFGLVGAGMRCTRKANATAFA